MRAAFPSLLICLIAVAGCQWLGKLDADRSEELARLDDRACEDRGYSWPGEAYVACRRSRADERQRERWLELQMSRQQQQPQVGIRPESPLEPYRPIPEERFRCFQATDAAGDRYVACREDN